MPAGIYMSSTKFPILPGEKEELVNEGTYGKALAEYLAAKLRERGWEIPFVCCEDWGWWVTVSGQSFGLGLCCYGATDAADRPELYVTLSREGGRTWSWRKFRSIDTTARVDALFAEIKYILANDPDVRILGYPEEFPLGDVWCLPSNADGDGPAR
ncbi:MAG: hypothetical protein K2Y05_10690 [Hyphomicrobiaceae bacterium]|nr:hypothetical protein [Hyphomicrobiaceae bacterium]